MDKLKKVLGIAWLALATAAAYFCIFILGIPKVISGKQEDLVFGVIILAVLTPLIVSGLAIFGYYSLVGEYSEQKEK